MHRDTTIAQLTATPSLVDGRVVYVDSPLVRAARDGRVLMIDEADKAPLEVVAILKGLIEDGQLLLADGRRCTSVLFTSLLSLYSMYICTVCHCVVRGLCCLFIDLLID